MAIVDVARVRQPAEWSGLVDIAKMMKNKRRIAFDHVA